MRIKFNLDRYAFISMQAEGKILDVGCVPSGMLIKTDNSYIDISEIKEGDKVYGHDSLFHKVTKKFERVYNGDIVEIRPSKINLPIYLTPEHPVYIIKNTRKSHKKDHFSFYPEWVPAIKVRPDDFIVLPTSNNNCIMNKINISSYVDYEYRKILSQKDLIGNNTTSLLLSNLESANNQKAIPYDLDLSVELLRLFGYYISEGASDGGSGISFSFNANEDEYIEEVVKSIKNIFGLDCEVRIINENTCNIRCASRILSNIFSNMFGIGAKQKHIPDELIDLDISLLIHLIYTIFLGDGHYNIKYGEDCGLIISTTSHILSMQLGDILLKNDIIPYITNQKNCAGYSSHIKDANIYRIGLSGVNANKFLSIIGSNKRYTDKENEYGIYYNNCYGKYLCLPVKKVSTSRYEGKVYNMEVDGCNSYQCETIIVHNCQDSSGWAHGHRMIGKAYDYLNSVPDITYFDMDKWSHPNFIRGDAHHLPFKENSFDTVVSGDVLEHVPDPIEFLRELIKAAKHKIVITTPDEYEWHKDLMPFKDLKAYADSLGMTIDELAKRDTLTAQTQYAKCTDFVKESKMQHLYHIRQFTPFSFIDLIHLVFRSLNPDDISKHNPISSFEINHFYHPLAPQTPEEAPDMAYWSCVFYKKET